MQYLGGKSRIKKEISSLLNLYNKEHKTLVSLFCGTCSIESLAHFENKILNDSHSYLIQLFLDLQSGREFPEHITADEYYAVKKKLDLDKGLSAFVGFGCSFGGKWWGGYARQTKGLNYAKTAKNSLKRKMEGLQKATFLCKDYKDVEISDGSVVYCDPPYKGTTSYSNSSEFCHKDFWEYMRKISEKNIVLISEISAPKDFTSIWEKGFTRNLEASNVIKSVEKIFMYNKENHDSTILQG